VKEDVFEREVEACYARVLRGLIAVAGQRPRAEDALHDALLDALAPGTLARMERVDAWLYAVGVRKLHRSRARTQLDAWLHPNAAVYPEPGLERVAALEVLAQLTPRQREVVVARFYLDLSFRDIAAALGISVGAASSTVSQAARRVQLAAGEKETVWTSAR
jgi:RNA polymerase sigma factor (sigma-70 family)